MLLDIAVILLAAKVAAELCERVRVPAVVGEILVGVLIGPSLLGLIDAHNEPVAQLAELGVLLLLVQVGMEMDLAELGRVGPRLDVGRDGRRRDPVRARRHRSGWDSGEDGNTALFVGAALTATSVGITARVFGDLKALATTEARVVLGAAVADDVLGLIILTVVVKIVTGGDVSALSILGTIGAAVGFLVVATVVGVVLVPRVFRHLERYTRSSASIVVIAFAAMLVFAYAAEWAKLAPIIGAFVAGLAIGRSDQHARVERDFGSTANLLIPVFFVQIGLDADIEAMARPAVLGLAGSLLLVAIIGKLASAGGAIGLRADKVIIGIGMIPRGEVGIIFASIGLAEGVLGDNQYAALLIMVLVTTLITPPLLRWRVTKLQAAPVDDDGDTGDDWEVAVVGDRIVLRGQPSTVFAIPLALQVAALAPERTTGLERHPLVRRAHRRPPDVGTGVHGRARRRAARGRPAQPAVSRRHRRPRAGAPRGRRGTGATARRSRRARSDADPPTPDRPACRPSRRSDHDPRRARRRRVRDRFPELRPGPRGTARSGRTRMPSSPRCGGPVTSTAHSPTPTR